MIEDDDIEDDMLSTEESAYIAQLREDQQFLDSENIESIYENFFIQTNAACALAEKLSYLIKMTVDQFTPFSNYIANHESINHNIQNYLLVTQDITDRVLAFYDIAESNNFFWHNCDLETYKTDYPNRVKTYLDKYSLAQEVDVIQNEYEFYLNNFSRDVSVNLSQPETKGVDFFQSLNFNKFLNTDALEFFMLLDKRKLEFLDIKLDLLGYQLEVYEFDNRFKTRLKESESRAEEKLQISGLPSLSILQRFELFKRIGLEKVITKLDTKQMSKYKLIAIIMGINQDNAKRLYNGSYRTPTKTDFEIIDKLIDSEGIKGYQ